jgi:hypothetical protein
MYSPDKKTLVYSPGEWWSDRWNPIKYGKDFDFSRGFFEQFGELIMKVPRVSLLTTEMENSEYSNYSSHLKNCYLLFDSTECNNTYY